MPTKNRRISKKYQKGIRFTCQMCGKCCRGLNEGEIYLYREDVQKLAAHLGFTGSKGLKEFARKYVATVTKSYYWRPPNKSRGKTHYITVLAFKLTGEDEVCQFLKGDECSVYDARPFQCRSFPIGWKMLMTKRKNFLTYARKCPGLKLSRKNKGKFRSYQEILNWIQREEQIEERYFLELKEAEFDIFKVYPFLSKEIHHV
ncbi:MAG: YkgJ family cysteine cluster protein [Promethearchaeia archaeon]